MFIYLLFLPEYNGKYSDNTKNGQTLIVYFQKKKYSIIYYIGY